MTPMPHTSRLQIWLLTLLCVTLLLGRVGGSHLHLCFDGKERASSLHLFDIDRHHSGSGMDAPHDDADVAVRGEMMSKNTFVWTVPPAMLSAIVLFTCLRSPRQFVAPLVARTNSAEPAFLRPPLRGPPRPSFF